MGHPMKVSEAVERMQQEITLSGPHAQIVVVKIEDLAALLASHEALRLAGEEARSWLKIANVKPYDNDDFRILVSIGFLRALSLAVEDASK